MKILHITDSHGTVKSPESRTDIYYLSFLKKMYELKYVIQQHDIKLIIHTGDLFHSSKVSDKFTGQLAEIIKSYGIPMYVVPGNHDIEGYTINTLDQTKLGLLYKTGVVRELDRDKNPIQLKSQKENLNISIVGQEYYKDIDTGNMSDFEMRSNNPNANFNILAIHGYLCDKPQNPNINHTLCQNITTDADVILSGHFHEAFSYHGPDFDVYNPGSLMRVEQNAYNKNHIPQYGILEITNDNGIVKHNYTMHQFKIAEPSDKVFDYNAKNQKKKEIITIENFKNSISNTNFNSNLNNSIENIISDVANNMSVTQDIINKTVDVYHDALNNSPDKLEVQQGYVADVSRKIIKHVEIKNFQSHEYTIVEFKDGLNTIIGESNSGKTSILRAIRWCLDNDPKGSEFITTGRDDCSVTVVFDDGTSIIRKRTRNDSGTYDVVGKTIQPDGTVTKWTQTYKGFANNLPVEIMNIHQMPKVNLTKDICTHLNMMSQLDGPFLITESPQVKAAIIGRLTGTQTIDLAIKETNATILNDSKSIKTITELKQEEESQLEQYKDLDIRKEYIDLFNIALEYCEDTIGKVIYSVSSLFYTLMSSAVSIDNYKNELSKTITDISVYSYLISIYEYILSKSNELDTFNDLLSTGNNISALNRKIKWIKVILSLKNFVDTYSAKINLYVQTFNIINKIAVINNKINNDTEIINKTTSNIEIVQNIRNCLNDIYKYINVLYKDVSSTEPLYNKFMLRRNNIANCRNDIDISSKSINETSLKINDLIFEQERIIQENNICPCCGQKITAKKHVQNINNFMKGR